MTRLFAVIAAVLVLAGAVAAQGKITAPENRHNLSAGGRGAVRSSEDEVCVFCHTPHTSNPQMPLWNQASSSGVTYTVYSSSTMAATVGLPVGSTKMCLACHDGTVAIGSTASRGRLPMTGLDAQGRLRGSAVLGTDLSDDHPVSFAPVPGSQIVLPPPGDPVKLDRNGVLHCTACHDPHRQDRDLITQKFLVKTNAGSALCLTCHQKQYWQSNPSTHRTSTRPYGIPQGAHTGYTTVADNACESCHRPHTAGTGERVLKMLEERTCGTTAGGQCHGSSGVAAKNIAAEFNKAYRHPVYDVTPSAHDPAEGPGRTKPQPETSVAAPRHAECPDCHNPHASYNGAASAPKGSGHLSGVAGIDSNGLGVLPSGTPPSVREYEICYKCHADSANTPQARGGPSGPYPTRVIPQFNMRLMFDPANPSHHAVEAAGRSTDVPSLRSPWTTASILYCTDCHDNDTGPRAPTPGSGPSGPHGSSFKHLLAARYEMDNSNTTESASAYALCYKCHDRSSILGNASFRAHQVHIVSAQSSCSICHDPHGVNAGQGATATNHSRLINFDKRFVTASSSGLLRFDHTGTRTGRCYLTCHGKDHNPLAY